MNKERVQLLVDALRSGEYKQKMGSYRNGDCYCSIGVAMEVYRKCEEPYSVFDCQRMYGASLKWYGLEYTQYYALYEANDEKEKSFSEIADMIEGWIT